MPAAPLLTQKAVPPSVKVPLIASQAGTGVTARMSTSARPVWTGLLELVGDPGPLVRRDVIRTLTDGTPAPGSRL